jgi:hypothetical protein
MVRIIALDPGGTTGIAVCDVRIIKPDYLEYDWNWYELGPHEHHKELFDFLKVNTVGFKSDFTIVCESFEFRQNRQRDNINLMSREYIGVVKLYHKMYGVPVVFQTAGAAKGFVSDDKLKVMGLYQKSSKHERDATRHLIYYMVNKLGRSDLIEKWFELT